MNTEIMRSARRKTTVSARMRGETLVVLAPVDIPEQELQEIIDKLALRLENRQRRRRLNSGKVLMAARSRAEQDVL